MRSLDLGFYRTEGELFCTFDLDAEHVEDDEQLKILVSRTSASVRNSLLKDDATIAALRAFLKDDTTNHLYILDATNGINANWNTTSRRVTVTAKVVVLEVVAKQGEPSASFESGTEGVSPQLQDSIMEGCNALLAEMH